MSKHKIRTGAVQKLAAVLSTIALVVGMSAFGASSAQAITGADFDPGYIISDAQFYDNDAMSEQEIQDFLSSRIADVGGCLTSNCLANFRMDTWTRPADRTVCSQYTGEAGESAARIIYKVQRACNISARVLLVTLQKEQSLITARAPSSWQMTASMGYGCPDTAPCDTQFYGFYNQMYKAAWQFHRYSTPDQFGNYQPGARYIQYNPDPNCGGLWVNIINNATAALYNYTPYTPNAESLANLYGSGGYCGAHGNRNFWTYYYGWFGSPTSGLSNVSVARISGADRYEVAVGISKKAFPGSGGVPVVYIATGENYPDALSAAPAATKQGGPLLLVPSGGIPASVSNEIARLKPAKIVVVGGSKSVSKSIYAGLEAMVGANNVVRLAGADRYEASRAIAQYAFPGVTSRVYLATGNTYPDALSASAAAGTLGIPVILVDGLSAGVDKPTRDLLTAMGVTQVTIAGGPNSVTLAYAATLKDTFAVDRKSGADRFEASRAIALDAFAGRTPTEVFIATGYNFPDALAGAALAGKRGAPLMVVPGWCVPQATIDAVKAYAVPSVTLLGGPNSLGSGVKYFSAC